MLRTGSADIVVVGAGIIGLSTAFQLARRTSGRIVVLERGAGLGEGSTGSSSAVCRAKYTRAETVQLARDGIAAYRNWRDFLGIPEVVARYHRVGNLWLGAGAGRSADAEVARLRSLGVASEALDDEALREHFPAIRACPVPPDLVGGEDHECSGGGGHLLETDAGYVDPMDALQDLLTAARALGVDVRRGEAVVAIDVQGGRVRSVSTGSGTIECGAIVNAAGPWSERLNHMAGLSNPWPLEPTRIQVVHIDRPDRVPGALPACADPAGGIYFRPQNGGQQIVVGSVLEQDERETVDPDDFDRTADAEFVAAKIHALQHRLRGLDTIRGVRGYSGLYMMNQLDVHPVVGRTPLEGYFVANGFSGHGFKLAPAIGSLVAQAIIGERRDYDSDIGPDFLSFERRPIEVGTRSVLA